MPSTDPPPRPHRYAQLTWPQVAERVTEDPVCVIPVATLEDHGYHLPIDTDVRLVEAIARGAVERFNGQGEAKALLCPTQVHGYTPHHLDFPGSVTLRWNVFVESLLDQGRSLIHHGFDRILIVNGHGSNIPLVNMAARLLNVEHRTAVCASSFYLTGEESLRVLEEHRTSGPGGMAHACELETSLYLAIRPDLVQMDRAVTEFARELNGGLIVTAGPSTAVHRDLIIALAARHKLPAVYFDRTPVAEGGLISYGPDLVGQFRQAASYVDRIFRGEKPATLPVQAPNKYELVINLKTAKALGLTIPPAVLARADEVIE